MSDLLTQAKAMRFIQAFSSPLVFLLLLGLVVGGPNRAYALTWTRQAGAPSQPMSTVAESANGQIIVTGVYGGTEQGLYRSTDGGVTWSEILTAAASGNEPWESVAISSDGTRIVGVQYNGHIWLSINSGLTWNEVGPGTADTWLSVTMSANGEYLAAASTYDNLIEISNDYGATWNTAPNISGKEWDAISYSPDGNYLAVGAATTTPSLAVSTNEGLSWTEDLGSTVPWYGLAAANGGVLLGGGNNVLYYSNSAGDSVVDTGLNDTGSWDAAAITPDGQSMLASTDNGHVWFSDTGESTWQEQHATSTVQWNGVAISSDGTKGVAIDATDNYLYTFAATAPSTPTLTTATPADTSVLLTFTAPTDDGGKQVTDYQVEYSLSGKNSWATVADGVSTSTNAIVTGLTSGTAYDFRVSAVNSIGTSTPSAMLTATTTGTAPSTVQNTSSGFSGQLRVPQIAAQMPVSVSTNSESELQNLEAEYQALLLKMPGREGSRVATTSNMFTRDLKNGMSGSDVKALQLLLISVNTGKAAQALAANGVTGYFGALTKAALVEYQKAHGISPASGYFGPLTRAYIVAHT